MADNAASVHLARLAATPRPTGGEALAAARAYCAGVLRDCGFVIHEHSFEYSAFPGAWGAPVAGAAASLGAIGIFLGRRIPAFAIGAPLAVAVVLLWLGVLARSGVLWFPVMRGRGINLEATRPRGGEPAVWLVAHLDSKWQPVSMIARIAGVVITTLAGLALLGANLLHFSDRIAAVLLIVAWLGSIPLMLSIVRDRGFGAVDNASGVAAVLEAAAALSESTRVGVLITDAEELALAGARAWATSRKPAVALNCDGIDDAGRLTVMYTNPQPAEVVAALRKSAEAVGERLRVIRLLPGVLTDSVALAGAGWRTVTLSRGTFRTLQRIHTSRDTLDSMRGTGIATAGRVLAATAMELA